MEPKIFRVYLPSNAGFWGYGKISDYIRVETGKRVMIDDSRDDERKKNGPCVSELTKLHPDREWRLFDPAAKEVIDCVEKRVLKQWKRMKEEEGEAFDETNAATQRAARNEGIRRIGKMYGFLPHGATKSERMLNDKPTLNFDDIVFSGLEEAYQNHTRDVVTTDTIIETRDPNANKKRDRQEDETRDRYMRARYQEWRTKTREDKIELNRAWHKVRMNWLQEQNVDLKVESIPELEPNDFAKKVLGLQYKNAVNTISYSTVQWEFKHYNGGSKPKPTNPLEAITTHCGKEVQVYVGITGQEGNARVGQYIANKYYHSCKETAQADGWEFHKILGITDLNFWDRRYNAGWAERYLQSWLAKLGTNIHGTNIYVEWEMIEPAILRYENPSGIPDTGLIMVYLCLRFR